MYVVCGGRSACGLQLPAPERRLPCLSLRNTQRGADTLRQQICLRQTQAHRSGAVRHARCAAGAASAASGKRSGYAIDVKAEPQPRSHMTITVTLPPPLVKKAYEKAMNFVKRDIDMPGFRKGTKGSKPSKISDDMVLKMVDGGKNRLKRIAIEDLLQTTLPEVLGKYDGVAINDSVHIDSSVDDLVAVFDEKSEMVYQVGIDLAPAVTWKAPYRDISVTVEAAGSEESDRAKVERMLQSLRKESGTLRVAPRGLQAGDVVIVDFDAARSDGNEEQPILGAKRENLRLDTETADLEFLPGLVDGMVGMKVGEERSVTVTLPQSWEPEQLRGVRADCSVKVKEIFEWELPELTDEFVRENIKSAAGLADAKEKLFEAQQLKTTEATAQNVMNALSEAVADIVEADVPQSMIRQIGEQEYQTKLLEMQQQGKLNPQVIAQLANEQMLQNFIEQQRDSLDHMCRAFLGFEAILQQENIEVTDAEVTAEFERGAQGFKEAGQEFDAERLREQATETVKATKVLDFLQKTCTINTTPYAGV